MMRSLAVAAAILAMGLAPIPPEKLSFVDLQPKANHKLDEDSGRGIEGNNLGTVPLGQQTLGGAKFHVGKGMLQLGSPLLKTPRPDRVEGIKVGRPFAKIGRPGTAWTPSRRSRPHSRVLPGVCRRTRDMLTRDSPSARPAVRQPSSSAARIARFIVSRS